MSSVHRWVVPSAEILTVGLPFCVFKLVTGWTLTDSVAPLGYALLALGAIDALLNTVNLGALLAAQRRVGPVCVAELALRDLGLAVDVFVSFGLVALAIGASMLAQLPAWALLSWNIAVVLNVLGAGTGRLLGAIRSRGPTTG